MPTSYTSLLGLALPVTGELSGTWGDTVNDYITQYLDGSVAGTQTISGSQTAVTLSKTTGSSLAQVGSGSTGSSQYSIINCTGNPASLLTITAPAASKPYIVINATSTSQQVKLVGAGPTTGVTLESGERAVVAWNGSDFVKIATSTADGVTTFSAGTTGFTPSTATSGAVTLAGTLATTNGGTGLTSFTANRVFYASSTSAIAQSANLTFDGTTLTVNNLTDSSLTSGRVTYATTGGNLTDSANLQFDGNNLGLGVTPSTILDIGANNSTPKTITLRYSSIPSYYSSTFDGSVGLNTLSLNTSNTSNGSASWSAFSNTSYGSAAIQLAAGTGASNSIRFLVGTAQNTAPTEFMRLDSSGNLGLGVTPSAWFTTNGTRAFQVGARGSFFSFNGTTSDVGNNIYQSASTDYAYVATAAASLYRQSAGAHIWYNAASGTAGTTATFTQELQITAAGFTQPTAYADTVSALGNTGTATTINLQNANVFTATLTGNCTFTLSNPIATGSSSFTLILTNDGTAGRTVAWSGGSFRFPGGAASLSRTTTANATDIWVFFTPDGGTTWYGSIPMKNMTT